MQDIDTQQPLVSVVIATFNMGQYLPQAVDSILQQTWKNLEIIVVDDGSTDNTAEAMTNYANETRIKYIRNQNQGQPKAKNCGIRAAQGSFIAFCDADDFWEKNKLEIQIPLFSDDKIGVVYSEVSFIDEKNQRYIKDHHEVRYSGKVTDKMLIENFVPFGTSVIRRECIEKNGVFDEEFRMGIDWDLWLRYSLEWDFMYAPERTYVYRVWSGQMSNNYKGRYDHAKRILTKFVSINGDKLNRSVVQKAWADMFIREGSIYAKHEKKFLIPFKNIVRGITLSPFELHGWKALVKLLVGRH